MFRQITLFAAAAVTGTLLVGQAVAQDGDSQSKRAPSLSERLQQFREDLFGDSPQQNVQRAPQPSGKPTPAASRLAKPDAGTPAPATQIKIAPPQLKAQSARRAQPSAAIPDAADEADDDSDSERDDEAPAKSASSPTVAGPHRGHDHGDKPKDEPRVANRSGVSPSKEAKESADSESEETRARLNARAVGGVLFSTESPVLSVEATGPRKVLIGKESQFVVKIRNSGAAANNVVVSVAIPSFAEVISAQATVGAAHMSAVADRRQPLEWKIDRLDAKSGATLTLKLVPRKSTPFDLAVQWTFTPDSTQTLVEVQEPKLAMAIAGPEDVLFGESKVYKLTVSNPGNGDTENVTVGLLPLGHSSDSAANHRLGTLKAGEARNIDIELTARQAGVIAIKAQAFAEGGLRAEAVQQVLVRRASLRVDVEAPKVKYAGTVATFHVKVVNAGNATADDVQVSAVLPPDAKYGSSNNNGRFDEQQGKVNWSVGTLQPGAQRVFEVQCSLVMPGENRMQFVAVAAGDLSAAYTSNTRVDAIADLKLEVRDPQGPVAVGEDAIYEVHIRNRGSKSADNVEVAVFFSEGLEAVSVEGGPNDISPGQVIFKPIAQLIAGDTIVYRVRSRAEKPGHHRFRAEVVCQSLQTKLAAEEATQFYGDEKAASGDISESSAEESPLRERPVPQPKQPAAGGEAVPLPQSPASE